MKRDISLRIKTIPIKQKIDNHIVRELKEKLPFTDEYFEFDKKNLEHFNFYSLMDSCIHHSSNYNVQSFHDEVSFSRIYHLLVNNGIIWLLLFNSQMRDQDLRDAGIDISDITRMINKMQEILKLSVKQSSDIIDFGELITLYEISDYVGNGTVAVLGKELIEMLIKNRGYTSGNPKKIILFAQELSAQMKRRNQLTVPFVNGKTTNYKYSLYDQQDESILLSGIYTDACFRIDGKDNDFLHYCMLDKNGFVIKITDLFDNFIARAAGFRNGNCVFINQLRTIYDEGGEGYEGEYDFEKEEIIETFKKACEDIVTTSNLNPNEKTKIDFVFVTKSYSLENMESNVPKRVTKKIGNHPMDNTSPDWMYFIQIARNLDSYEKFNTDYGNYSLICMASSKRKKLNCMNICPEDVPALYERPRNPVLATTQITTDIVNKINKVKAIQTYLNEEEFDYISIPEKSTVFMGDNWYLVYNSRTIIENCVLEFDKKAVIELETVKSVLKEERLVSGQYENIKTIEEVIQEQVKIQEKQYSKTLGTNY